MRRCRQRLGGVGGAVVCGDISQRPGCAVFCNDSAALYRVMSSSAVADSLAELSRVLCGSVTFGAVPGSIAVSSRRPERSEGPWAQEQAQDEVEKGRNLTDDP